MSATATALFSWSTSALGSSAKKRVDDMAQRRRCGRTVVAVEVRGQAGRGRSRVFVAAGLRHGGEYKATLAQRIRADLLHAGGDVAICDYTGGLPVTTNCSGECGGSEMMM